MRTLPYYCFTTDRSRDDVEDVKLPIAYNLRAIPAVQFANERRRGWKEAPDCPRRDPTDIWDQRRNARMQKRQPGGSRLLCVESLGWAGGEFGVDQAVNGLRIRYSLESGGDLDILDDLQWADWDSEGRLLAATRSGKIQIRNLDADNSQILFEEDLSVLEPSPVPAPDWAQRW